MLSITINHQTVDVPDGSTILEAAAQAGISIPTLCHHQDLPPGSSCMLCVVKDTAAGNLLPSCTAPAKDGMVIETDSEEVHRARRDVLELLLSEHVGDCEAPCRRICPAHLDIPLMLRHIARGREDDAAWIAQRDLALPSVLAQVCPAPCENGCRRGELDHPLAIRESHRTGAPFRPPAASRKSDKIVVVVGSGPAGLACAWTLRLLGHRCVLMDEAEEAGGVLRGLSETELPRDLLASDLAAIRGAGVTFRLGCVADPAVLREEYDAVVIAASSGADEPNGMFFARERSLVVGAVGQGKAAAQRADHFLRGIEPLKPPKRFDSRIGLLKGKEVEPLLGNCPVPISPDGPRAEAARCLHCDCRNLESCRLRLFADSYQARQHVYPSPEPLRLELQAGQGEVVFESGKCIKCGLCIRLTEREGESWGMTFHGRGFDVRVGTPFEVSLKQALERCGRACVEICPTGALALVEAEEREL